MNQELHLQINRWTKAAEELQKQLLFAAEEGSPALREQLLEALSPWDFSNGNLREKFSYLHERWIAGHAKIPCAEDESEEAKLDPDFRDKIEHLVRLVGTIRVMRLFSETSQILQSDLKKYDSLLEQIIKEVSARFRRLTALRVNPAVWKSSKERALDVLTEIERLVLKGPPIGEDQIGWADLFDLNFLAGYFRPGRLYLLGSRPGEGKTAFLTMLARSASLSKNRAGFIALRDSENNACIRLMGTGNPYGDEFGKEGMGNLCQAASKMAATFPAVVSLPDASTVSLCEFAKELAAVKRINFLLIDDIGFAFDGTEYPDKQGALMERIARLRDLARSLQIPVVASVTLDLSNVCEGLPVAAPTPEEILKYSSADFLAVLTEIRYAAGDRIHEFEILRNPFGPTAKVPLVFHKNHQQFYELDTEARGE